MRVENWKEIALPCHPGSAAYSSSHRRNHPMGPVGRVPSNSGDHGDQVYFSLPQTSLLNLSGEGKKSREGNG